MKNYILAIALVLVASYVGNKFKNYINNDNDDYDMIREYVLKESPLYGFNKPKMWIHSKFEINARKWRDFQSRNTCELNQPYIHLCIQSLIDHNSQDFHVCLIDDKSFSKLLPDWTIDISALAEPMKTQMRNVAMLKLLYVYGGIIVPDSFVCTKSMITLFNEAEEFNCPFVCEALNRSANMNEKRSTFVPSLNIIGSPKKHPILSLLIDTCLDLHKNGHIFSSHEFNGTIAKYLQGNVDKKKLTLINGSYIGIKDIKNKPILLEDLLSEKHLDTISDIYGVYIPRDELLVRNKYNWFSVLSKEEIFESNLAIVYIMKSSMVDNYDKYKNSMISKGTM